MRTIFIFGLDAPPWGVSAPGLVAVGAVAGAGAAAAFSSTLTLGVGCGGGGVGVDGALPVGKGLRGASPVGSGLRTGFGVPSLEGDSFGAKPGRAVRPGAGDAALWPRITARRLGLAVLRVTMRRCFLVGALTPTVSVFGRFGAGDELSSFSGRGLFAFAPEPESAFGVGVAFDPLVRGVRATIVSPVDGTAGRCGVAALVLILMDEVRGSTGGRFISVVELVAIEPFALIL